MPNQMITLRDSLFSALTVFLNFIPTLIGGLVVLAVGWFLAALAGRLMEKILAAFRVDHASEKVGLSPFLVGPKGQFTLSHGVGYLTKWFVRLLFLQAVANLFMMPEVTAILNSMLLMIPNIAVAMLILVAGLYIGQFVSVIVKETLEKSGMTRAGVISSICRFGIVGFAIIAALNHLGIAAVAVNILYIGFVASLALAFGLAFGLGGQAVAAEMTRNWYELNQPGKLKSISGGGQVSSTTKGGSGTDREPNKPAAIF
jgi:hypothetical protein